MAIVSHGGKHALTRYRVLRPYAGGTVSLVECRLATGRTHQIRVHMTSIGHCLVGDQTYGRQRSARVKTLTPEVAQAITTFPRQALHAYLLGFIHPVTGLPHHYESPIPADMDTILQCLERL